MAVQYVRLQQNMTITLIWLTKYARRNISLFLAQCRRAKYSLRFFLLSRHDKTTELSNAVAAPVSDLVLCHVSSAGSSFAHEPVSERTNTRLLCVVGKPCSCSKGQRSLL